MALQDFLDALNRTAPIVAKQYGLDPAELLTTMIMAAHLEGGLGEEAATGDGGYSVGRYQFYTNGGHGSTLLNQGYTREQIADDTFQAEHWTPIIAQQLIKAKQEGLSGRDAMQTAVYRAERPAAMYPASRVDAALQAASQYSDVDMANFGSGATSTTSTNSSTQPARSRVIGGVLDEMFKDLPWQDQKKVQDYARENKVTESEAASSLRQLWLSEVDSLSTLYSNTQRAEQNMFQTPDGFLVPMDSLPPEVQEAITASNENTWRKFSNDYAIDQYNMSKDRAQAQFTNKVSALDNKLKLDQTNLQRANIEIARAIQGNQEARDRAKYVSDTLMTAAPWATGGKTEFTPSDLGAIGTEWGRYAGIGPNDVAMRYPGSMKIDPASLLSQYSGELGVSGPIPNTPSLYAGPGDLPDVPELPGVPSLLPPTRVQTRVPTRPSAPAQAGSLLPPTSSAPSNPLSLPDWMSGVGINPNSAVFSQMNVPSPTPTKPKPKPKKKNHNPLLPWLSKLR